MKKIICMVFTIVFIAAIVQAGEVIRITNGEWAPYLSKDLPHHGFASHVVKAAFATQGIIVEYGFFPWKRSYKLAKEGKWNGSVVWVHTPRRAISFLYSDVVVEDREYLFHLESYNLKWDAMEDLKGLTIGGTLHTVYPAFQKAEESGLLTILRAGTYENLYHRLLKGRIHAIPQVAQVGAFLIRTKLTPREQAQITYSPTIIETREYALILSKAVSENERFLKKFNTGLKLLRSSGLYNKMRQALSRGEYDPQTDN